MNSRSEQEYRALIRGWRIRLREIIKQPGNPGLSIVIDEMEEEVPDFTRLKITSKFSDKSRPTFQ